MTEHFVGYIKIKHYKCFDDFSAEGFKRVNLIGGRNNVGKTALMEALFVSAGSRNTQDVMLRLNFLNYCRIWADVVDNIKSLLDKLKSASESTTFSTNLCSIQYGFDEVNEIPGKYKIIFNESSLEVTESDFKEVMKSARSSIMNAAYIPSKGDSQKDIIHSFTAIQKKDREPEINEFIQRFDASIESVKVIGGNSIECKATKSDGSSSYLNINDFGDGLRHYIAIIADLFAAENGFAFVDEIDNGIHYSSLDDLWEIILTLSKELNVQVFATTHSKECIEAYCRAAEKLQDEDITFTTLVRNKEKQVKAIVRDYELFTNSIHDDHEVRGW